MTSRLALAAVLALAAACDDDGDGGTPDAALPTGTVPTIVQVQWLAPPGCSLGKPGDYTIITTATDGDTPVGLLNYRGSLETCAPPTWSSMSATQIVSCPNSGAYAGTAEVRDPEGHAAVLTFTMIPCANGTEP